MLSASQALWEGGEPYRASWILAEPAREAWQRRAYFALRHQVFVEEQRMFAHSDRDAEDAHALHLVALATSAGMPDEVVGVVRIYPASLAHGETARFDGPSDGVWYGGRLAVQTPYRRSREVGAALTRAAVGAARGLGARRFLATVQAANVGYFARHGFVVRAPTSVCGQPHQLMEAPLEAYAIPTWIARSKPEAA